MLINLKKLFSFEIITNSKWEDNMYIPTFKYGWRNGPKTLGNVHQTIDGSFLEKKLQEKYD